MTKSAAIQSRDELNYFMVPLERENTQLRRENAQLRRENARLRRQKAELERETAGLKEKPRLLLAQELDDVGVWRWVLASAITRSPPVGSGRRA